MSTPISVVIITKNQAEKLLKTIEAVKNLTNDIVVIDSFSDDETEAVVDSTGTRFYQRAWTGYSDQKNFGNNLAKNNWILSVDDDEVVSEKLIENIKKAFENQTTFDAFDLPFRTVFCDQFIKFGGWNPESHVRLFDKTKIYWNSDAVHEGLTLKPEHKIGKLSGYVFHYTVDTLQQFYQKTDRYSTLFAERSFVQGKKSTFVKRYLSPAVRFIREYFLRLGFLDGYYGFIIAKDNARYTYLKYKKLEEKTTIFFSES